MMVLVSILTLLWQLIILFACCSGVGLSLRFFFPKEFSLLNKVLFSLIGGLSLVVLIPQNLVYLGVPVRISAWFILGAALIQLWICRHRFVAWKRTCWANSERPTLAMVILLTITFHSIAPIRQGLDWYYGKGLFDQINYVLLAEFLKEQPYSTTEHQIGLRPWLVGPVGYQVSAEQLGMSSGPGREIVGLKKQRIGQSIITAEISVWSGTDGKGAYAATILFFLTLLAICLYVLLRETGVDHLMSGSGALLAVFLPAVTRLSLDGFLSQISILFVFPFFVSLLRRRELSARSLTLFFSLTLAYVVSAYSEIAPLALCTMFLGILFVRNDQFRSKRLMLMGALLFIAFLNPYYLRNLVGFLAQQYYYAANLTSLDRMAPQVLTLGGWSGILFGTLTGSPVDLFFAYGALSLGVLSLAGVFFLSRRDKLIFGSILLPGLLVIVYLATRTPLSSYPIAKIMLSILPLVIGLVFVPLARIPATLQNGPVGVLKKLFCALFLAAAAAGSIRYYSEVLNNEGLLKYVREPHFLSVCRQLEKIKNQRVLVFETHPLLTPWLCYHARHNDVYFDGRFISDSAAPPAASFSKIPDLANLDLVATRDRIVDLRAPSVSYLTLVDDPGEDRSAAQVRYWIGPPVDLRFLALRPISANLQMQLAPGPEVTTLPIPYFLQDDQGHVFHGELWSKKLQVVRMNFPRGFSKLQLFVQAKEIDSNNDPSFPIRAELDGIEINNIDSNPGQ
jgi:hypothetical protein